MDSKNYFVAPVGIDAYRTNLYVNHFKTEVGAVTFEKFREIMEEHAASWGAEAVGKWMLVHGDVPRVSEDDPRVVMVWGFWGEKTYLGVVDLPLPAGTDYFDLEFVEVTDFNDGWDVT